VTNAAVLKEREVKALESIARSLETLTKVLAPGPMERPSLRERPSRRASRRLRPIEDVPLPEGLQ